MTVIAHNMKQVSPVAFIARTIITLGLRAASYNLLVSGSTGNRFWYGTESAARVKEVWRSNTCFPRSPGNFRGLLELSPAMERRAYPPGSYVITPQRLP